MMVGGGAATDSSSGDDGHGHAHHAHHDRDHQQVMMMTNSSSSSRSSVPPGFRFHPTDEELLYYYLRKKVSYEPIDLDVIREVDLNKLEPWDLKDKCRIGSGPHQNEWYFFSHKDKKYPTGTRTNRATAAGFWKATGRDKAIHSSNSNNSNSKRIGMRKTLVFYIGRAPHGQKTDWIMHEYRLDDEDSALTKILHHHHHHQEDGWVVCRVFKKKSNTTSSSTINTRGFQQQRPDDHDHHLHELDDQEENLIPMIMKAAMEPKQNSQALYHDYYSNNSLMVDGSTTSTMHLPQLLSPESMSSAVPHPHSSSSLSGGGGGRGSSMQDHLQYYCSQNLLSLTSGSGSVLQQQQGEKEKLMVNSDWSFLDKLLASHQSLDEQTKWRHSSLILPQQAPPPPLDDVVVVPSTQRFPLIPFHYVGSEPAGFFKFSPNSYS